MGLTGTHVDGEAGAIADANARDTLLAAHTAAIEGVPAQITEALAGVTANAMTDAELAVAVSGGATRAILDGIYAPIAPAVVPVVTGSTTDAKLASLIAGLVGRGIITDASGGVAPTWLSSQVPGGTVGQLFYFAFAADGNPAPTFSVTAGTLPAGLTLTTGGILSGTPTTAASYSFTVSAHNTTAPDATAPRTVVIAAAAVSTGGFYGPGVGYDTKSNIPIGPDGQKLAIRFRASTTSALNSVRITQRTGPGGYSGGSGGTMTVSVRADDGSGHPSASSLATLTFNPSVPGGVSEIFSALTFPSPATLTAGTIYYIVCSNPDPANFISINSVYVYNGTVPRQPRFADSDYGVMYTTGAWGALNSGLLPVVDLTYANGVHDGQAYYEAMIDIYRTISGTSQARERFTVAGGNRTVTTAGVRVRRTSGSSPLTLTLETGAGTLIEAVTVPAASIPVSAAGGDNGGAVWANVTFTTPRVLTNGAEYILRASTPTGTAYTTHPIRAATDKGLASFAFTEGEGEYTTGGSWTAMYYDQVADMQCYLGLA